MRAAQHDCMTARALGILVASAATGPRNPSERASTFRAFALRGAVIMYVFG